MHHPFSLLLVAAASLVILFPQRVGLLLVMVCVSMCNTLDWMPVEPNHILFEFLLNLGIAGALGWTLLRQYSQGLAAAGGLQAPGVRTALFNSFAPFVRISLVILYFYAVLHKLNSDYFTVAISCSTSLLKAYGQRLHFLPDTTLSHWGAVWGTIAIEAAIPLFLCFRRTRLVGILLGLGFHFFLAFHPAQGLYSFSGLLFALFLLFVPAEFPGRLQLLAQNLLGRWQQPVLFAIRAIVCLGAIGLIASGRSAHLLSVVGLLVFLAWGLTYIGAFLRMLWRNTATPEPASALLRVRPAFFWLIPALVLFNGMNPYLGLKTEKSFAMFSNLRTENGVSNHFLIRKPLYLTNLQNDLVEIKETNLDELKVPITDNQYITAFELRRIASEAKTNFYANYIRNGKLQTLRVENGVSNQPDLIKPYPWLVAKFVRFRPVDKGPCTCKH